MYHSLTFILTAFLLTTSNVFVLPILANITPTPTHPLLPAGLVAVSSGSKIVAIPQEVARQLTNARRLSKGYALKAPRHHHRASTSIYSSRASIPSPSAITSSITGPALVRGCITVTSESTGALLGYISKNYNEVGAAILTASRLLCLLVELDPQTAVNVPTSLHTLNGPDERYPFFGIVAVSGLGSYISPGRPDKLLFTSIPYNPMPAISPSYISDETNRQTIALSTSATYDNNDQMFTFHWTNADSSPLAYIGLIDSVIFITGDKNQVGQGVALGFSPI
ncbi:hypothetical protein F5050DRAFT_1779521 [Lentinula boryana]|uniref:Acid protease n=1 Tax=Lentinula boryana TaxID=40481 RepID=A0ABQ8Q5H1_9AGAR|nr:hypothetical protein F5050DRAFT_1779521 [Lentinula boryana]